MARKHIEYYAIGTQGFGDRIIPKEGDVSSSVFRGFKGQEFLAGIAKLFIDGIAEIQQRLKPEIQGEQIAKLANELLKRIPKGQQDLLAPIAASFYEMKNQVAKISIGPSNDPAAMIRRMEIRTHLKSIDGKERLRIFQEAVDSGDNEIAGAYFESHRIFSLLGEDILAAGREKLLRKRDPNLADAFFGAERAGSILAENFEHVITELTAYAQTPPDQIQSMFAAIPKADWKHQKSADGKFIDNNLLDSMLPKPTYQLNKK